MSQTVSIGMILTVTHQYPTAMEHRKPQLYIFLWPSGKSPHVSVHDRFVTTFVEDPTEFGLNTSRSLPCWRLTLCIKAGVDRVTEIWSVYHWIVHFVYRMGPLRLPNLAFQQRLVGVDIVCVDAKRLRVRLHRRHGDYQEQMIQRHLKAYT